MAQAPFFFSQRLTELAKTHAQQIALIDRDSETTFAQLEQQAKQLAGNLHALGIKHDQRVAVWLPNCLAWVQTFLACAHLGATVLAVNTRFRSKEVADIIGRGKADWLVIWPEFKGIAFADILADVPADVLARLKGIVTLGDFQSPAVRAIAARGCAVYDYARLIDTPSTPHPAVGNAGAICFTTSGTTSLPKFVLHDQHTLIVHGEAMQEAYGYNADSRILASAPFCGAFGFSTLTGGLVTGCTVVSEAVSDTHSTLTQLRRHRVSHTYANNESILKLLEAADSPADFASCKLFGFANFSPAVTSLLEQAERNHLPLTGLYGSSELQALVAAQPTHEDAGDLRVRYLAGGKLIHPTARVRVTDPSTGKILATGESGEIEIFSPSLMIGYLDNPEATAKAMTTDGFFKTGDLGYALSEQQFVFQARMGDSMRLSGFLVNPAEIEQTVESLPGVKACQVVGGTLGTKTLPVAFVILREGEQADTVGWTAACKREMAGYKVPVHFEVVTSFPSVESANAVKIQKNKLRDMADAWLAKRS
ncbi:AMP-binding protein [Alcaligenaceae bacterium LF4-65]|uniref:Long-chain-fatty-acid--CoA ligase n=1 Tax=Zwartia hollandica TaxID=324606 RepID=A0A953ND14_9BURK|nr:AMP-binding protein [Zwartia hollandica]MBZ1351404.1 AMP-binding protein [Zwartia hollandica]